MRGTLIIGAGAAGLFTSRYLPDSLLLEHNPKPAQKIKISGGGKCNVTNKEISSYHYHCGDTSFVQKVLQKFDNTKLLRFLAKVGCRPVVRKKGQYFCPHSSSELIDILLFRRPQIELGCEVEGVEKTNQGFVVHTNKGDYLAKTVLVASGGLSYKKIGASGIGYEIAKSFGHTITPLRPALVGLTVQKEQFWFKQLAGISMRARVEVAGKVFEDDILFTHKGISGPAILNASLYWERGAIILSFLPRLPRLSPHKIISTQLPLPKRFVKAFLKSIGIEDKKVGELSLEEKKRLELLCRYPFAPAGTFGYERAEVTKGGVSLQEIQEDMQSRLVPGLFFAGEVLDVTGELGGYNFQWAFSSAYSAAKGIKQFLVE